jgi:cell division protease FtsH
MRKMMVLLAGRAAEQLVLAEISTGASDDLVKVTDIARSMVMQYGMDEKLGNLVYEAPRSAFIGAPETVAEPRRHSEESARRIDDAVRGLVASAFSGSLDLLARQRDRLERGAALLLERETLDQRDLVALLSEVPESGAVALASVEAQE